MFDVQIRTLEEARGSLDSIRSDGHQRRPRKVLLLIDHLHMGGAERVLAAVAPRMAARGVSVRVCVLDGDPYPALAGDLIDAGVPVDRIAFRRLVDPLGWRNLNNYLVEHKPDIVHTQLEFANVAGLTLSKRQAFATMVTLHTIEPRQSPDRAELRRRLERLVLARSADRIVSVSRALMDFCLDQHGLPSERLRVLHNGINLDDFRPLPADVRKQVRRSMGLPSKAPVFITVAVLRQPKGIEFMIRAFSLLCRRDPDARYLIVGSGDDRDRLENLARELGVSSQVIFAGMRQDIPALVAASDVFVLPSLTEALPTVLAEAAAGGKPIIATTVGGVPEMVADGETGLLVPPSDSEALVEACGRMLENPSLRQRMGRAGRRLAVDRFDLEQHVDHLLNLYDEMMVAQSEKRTCA